MPRSVAPAIALAIVALALLASSGVANASTIANDDYPGETIGSIPFSDALNTEGATTEPGEPSGSCLFGAPPQATVWYNYTPSEDLLLRADTLGSDYDTIVTVWTESAFPGGALAEVACSDDFTFEGDSGQAFEAEAGRTYYIQAGGYPDTTPTGNLVVNLAEVFPPDNDDFADATPVGSLPFSDTGDTGAASLEATEPSPSCVFGFPVASSVWYSFTATEDGAILAETIGSTFDTVIAIYKGSPDALVEIACNDEGGYFFSQSRLGFHAQAGTTYYFQVSGFVGFGASSGPLEFNLDTLDVPDCQLSDNAFPDPVGDAFGTLRPGFDIVSVRAGVDSENLCLSVEWVNDLAGSSEPAPDMFALIAIDADSDPATGAEPSSDFFCESPSGMGQDAEAFVTSTGIIAPMISGVFGPLSPSGFPLPPDDYGIVTFDASGFSVTLPLDPLGGDEVMDLTIVLGSTAEPTDCAPNEGHISLPISARLQGDVDCDEDSDAVDAQKVLAHLAGLPVNMPPGCAGPGQSAGIPLVGDVDCDGDVDSVDALKILQNVAGFPVVQQEPCADIGDPVARAGSDAIGEAPENRPTFSPGSSSSKPSSAWPAPSASASASAPARPAP